MVYPLFWNPDARSSVHQRVLLEISENLGPICLMPEKNRSDFYGFLRLPYLSCFNSQGTNREPPSLLFRQASMLRQIHLSPRTRQILQDFNFIFLIQALTIPLKIWSNKTTSRWNGSTTSAISREDQIANLAPEGPDPSTAWQPEGPDPIKWWDKKRQQNWDKVGRKYYWKQTSGRLLFLWEWLKFLENHQSGTSL